MLLCVGWVRYSCVVDWFRGLCMVAFSARSNIVVVVKVSAFRFFGLFSRCGELAA